MLKKIVKVLLYIYFWLALPTVFKGKRNIPKGRVIFVCNHTSNNDGIVLEMAVWRTQYFLAKKELFKNKFVGGILKILGGIPIEREGIDLTAMKTCLTVLKKEKILTIFPEGTRNRTSEDLGAVKAGAAMFAIKAKTPIVPVWIKHKPRFLRPNVLRFGEAFTLEEFYDKKLTSEILEEAGNKIAQKLLGNKIK